MFEIHPNALYTRSDLETAFSEMGVDVDTFISKIKPKRISKAVYWGADLIEAINEAEPLQGLSRSRSKLRFSRERRRAKAAPFTDKELGIAK